MHLNASELYKLGVIKFSNTEPNDLTFHEVSLGIDKKDSAYLIVTLVEITHNVKNETDLIMSTYDTLEHGLILCKHHEISINNILNILFVMFKFNEANFINNEESGNEDIFSKILKDYHQTLERNKDISLESGLTTRRKKGLNELVIFSFLLIKHCIFYHKKSNNNIKNFFYDNKFINPDKIEKFMILLEQLSGPKVVLGQIKVIVDENTIKYYDISIDVNTSSKDSQVLIVFKNITNEYYLEKSEKALKRREISISKLNHNLKIPITAIKSLMEENINKTNSILNPNRHSSNNHVDNPVLEKLNNENQQLLSDRTPNKTMKEKSALISRLKNATPDMGYIDSYNSHLFSCLYYYLMQLLEDFSIKSSKSDITSESKERKRSNNTSLYTDTSNKIIFQKFTIFKGSKILEILDFCYVTFYTRQKNDPYKKGVKVINDFNQNLSKLRINNEFKNIQLIVNIMSVAYDLLLNGELRLSAKFDTNKMTIKIMILANGNFETKEKVEQFVNIYNSIYKSTIPQTKDNPCCLGLLNAFELEEYLAYSIKMEFKDNIISFCYDLPCEIASERASVSGYSNILPSQKYSNNSLTSSDPMHSKRVSNQSWSESLAVIPSKKQSGSSNESFVKSKRLSFTSVSGNESLKESLQFIDDFLIRKKSVFSKFQQVKSISNTNMNNFTRSKTTHSN